MTSKDVVLVTGGSGFVGSAVVRQAIAAGLDVRASIRDPTRPGNLAGLDVELAPGDLRDPAAALRAAKGCRFVIHAAADYRLWAVDPDEIIDNNVSSTRAIMQAALRVGCERVVYTSSVATLASRPGSDQADESVRLTPQQAVGAYKRSKVMAERLVESLVSAHRLPAVIVNPSTPLGARDARPTPTGRVIVEAARGRVPAYVQTGLNLVHVDDVACGHIAALKSGRIGERYILGGQNATLLVLLTQIARLVGRPAPWLKLPRRLLFPLAYAAEAFGRRTGREPFVTLDGLRLAKRLMFFTSAKAETELGYRARPYEQGLQEALAWFRAEGVI